MELQGLTNDMYVDWYVHVQLMHSHRFTATDKHNMYIGIYIHIHCATAHMMYKKLFSAEEQQPDLK